MSFQTTICSVMTADPSVNALIDGGIYFDILPTNFNLTKSNIVYNYSEGERIDVLAEKNVLTMYTFYVKIISPDTNTLLLITDAVNSYLTSYNTTNILDISFTVDNHQNGIVEEQDIFENTIEYSITYKN